MQNRKLKIEELRELINKGEASDPLVFLESVASGSDPRSTSQLYEFINEINEFNDGAPPDQDEWEEILNYIHIYHRYQTVSLNESITAAKTMAEYVHAKKKQIDTNINVESKKLNLELSEEEIELFKEKFNAEF